MSSHGPWLPRLFASALLLLCVTASGCGRGGDTPGTDNANAMRERADAAIDVMNAWTGGDFNALEDMAAGDLAEALDANRKSWEREGTGPALQEIRDEVWKDDEYSAVLEYQGTEYDAQVTPHDADDDVTITCAGQGITYEVTLTHDNGWKADDILVNGNSIAEGLEARYDEPIDRSTAMAAAMGYTNVKYAGMFDLLCEYLTPEARTAISNADWGTINQAVEKPDMVAWNAPQWDGTAKATVECQSTTGGDTWDYTVTFAIDPADPTRVSVERTSPGETDSEVLHLEETTEGWCVLGTDYEGGYYPVDAAEVRRLLQAAKDGATIQVGE